MQSCNSRTSASSFDGDRCSTTPGGARDQIVKVTLTPDEFQQLQSEIMRCHHRLREEEKTKLEMKARLDQV